MYVIFLRKFENIFPNIIIILQYEIYNKTTWSLALKDLPGSGQKNKDEYKEVDSSCFPLKLVWLCDQELW